MALQNQEITKFDLWEKLLSSLEFIVSSKLQNSKPCHDGNLV